MFDCHDGSDLPTYNIYATYIRVTITKSSIPKLTCIQQYINIYAYGNYNNIPRHGDCRPGECSPGECIHPATRTIMNSDSVVAIFEHKHNLSTTHTFPYTTCATPMPTHIR